MTILELIGRIESRPGMYLSEPTIHNLRAFLDGWKLERENNDAEKYFIGFHYWIEKRFQISTTQSWASIIACHSPNSVSALSEAFKLFREYAESPDFMQVPSTPGERVHAYE